MMRWVLGLLTVLLALLHSSSSSHSLQLQPEEVVVSLSIDSSSVEIQREALRLLTSIQLFGGTLKSSHFFICINHDIDTSGGDDNDCDNDNDSEGSSCSEGSSSEEVESATRVLVEQIRLLDFENLVISYSKSLPYPAYALSLNKMCAFNPRSHVSPSARNQGNSDDGSTGAMSAKYMLYLDADIFVARDPLPLLAQYLPLQREGETVLLCGRPFTSVHDQVNFAAFSGLPYNPYLDSSINPLVPTLDGGWAYYGMCNTGVYFMELSAATSMSRMAGEYLERTTTLTPDLTSSFLIDSFILWASQQMLRFRVEIFSLALNYIVPAEDFYERFIHEEMENGAILHHDATVRNDDSRNMAPFSVPVSLFHFSRGSDINFEGKAGESGEVDRCRLVLRSGAKTVTNVRTYFEELLATDTAMDICLIFNHVLEPFSEYVTLRDDSATSYFR